MKKIFLLFIITASVLVAQKNPFSRGVNLTDWFQAGNAKQIQFSKYTIEDFKQIKSLGVDVIRLPINLHSMTSGFPNYDLDPLFVYFLDQVIDWTEELGINLIIDNHTFDVTQSTSIDIDKILIPVWTKMAEHYKTRSDKIFYEILNEPHGISDVRWNQIQKAVVDSIRTIDKIHTIIIGPANWNSYSNLSSMPVYEDTNLIYTFHFYDPFVFTHQGASWTDPALTPLSNVPFPYNAVKMPACPTSLQNTWVKSELQNNYITNGTVAKVQSLLNTAVNFQKSRNVKLLCGEFGVYIPNSPDSDRTFWYETVRKYLEQNNIAWTIWDYRGGFGLYKKNSNELFDYDLNTNLLTALGFNVPPQSIFVIKPDSTAFNLYTDYIGQNINNASYSSGTLDFYYDKNQYDGNYCLYWSRAKQYEAVSLKFIPIKDLSNLVQNDYVLDCMVKGNNSNASFDIRFLDSKTSDPNDHPWRSGYKVNNSVVAFDNNWHNLRIPLKNFSEFGSWDNNTWYTPAGLFDWKNINLFEIVAEDKNLTGMDLWFDNIKIFNPNISSVDEQNSVPLTYELKQNYPNPFNPSTVISYQLSEAGYVTLRVYDILGRNVVTLVDEFQQPGLYYKTFDTRLLADHLSSGVYIYRLTGKNVSIIKKMMLVK